MNLYTPPAWITSILCLVLAYLFLRRAIAENNIPLYGKIGILFVIAVTYALFSTDYFDILTTRALGRYIWIIYLLAEVVYHWGRSKWISKN